MPKGKKSDTPDNTTTQRNASPCTPRDKAKWHHTNVHGWVRKPSQNNYLSCDSVVGSITPKRSETPVQIWFTAFNRKGGLKQMVTININEFVKFRLTEEGVKRLPSIKRDACGESRLQLWEFCQLYGKIIYMGLPPLIQNNVLVIGDKNEPPPYGDD